MTTLNEILSLGFCEYEAGSQAFDEYTNGIVKVHVSAGVVVNVFVMDIKVNGVRSIAELMYICKRVNAQA